jgi:hypothetical protein
VRGDTRFHDVAQLSVANDGAALRVPARARRCRPDGSAVPVRGQQPQSLAGSGLVVGNARRPADPGERERVAVSAPVAEQMRRSGQVEQHDRLEGEREDAVRDALALIRPRLAFLPGPSVLRRGRYRL